MNSTEVKIFLLLLFGTSLILYFIEATKAPASLSLSICPLQHRSSDCTHSLNMVGKTFHTSHPQSARKKYPSSAPKFLRFAVICHVPSHEPVPILREWGILNGLLYSSINPGLEVEVVSFLSHG